MIDYRNAEIKYMAVHKVGNKLTDDGIRLSQSLVQFGDAYTPTVLLQYFISSFNANELYRFRHPTELSLHEIFTFVSRIFDRPETLHAPSVEIARHLYEQSVHPKIAAGELCVAYFTGLVVGGQSKRAIGIFKSETKDTFLKIDSESADFHVTHEDGINVKKLEKGCLIWDDGHEDGYRLNLVDAQRSGDAQYWKENFLSIVPVSNEYHQTKELLAIAKQYVTEQLNEDFVVSKADQIDFLNRSVNYFKQNDTFDNEAFATEVFQDEGIINSFRNFDRQYRDENELEPAPGFSISQEAVKKQARMFKSVLKLDKNFHIYIHGDRELIEQGVDDNGRKFYKIYFEEES
ncbi:MAG: nucleoid-associated protein [Edaphocola sp.]